MADPDFHRVWIPAESVVVIQTHVDQALMLLRGDSVWVRPVSTDEELATFLDGKTTTAVSPVAAGERPKQGDVDCDVCYPESHRGCVKVGARHHRCQEHRHV